MGILNANAIIYVIVALLAVFIIVAIVKKAIKLLLFVLAIVVLFSAYNIFIKGVSPIDEVKGYITDASYTRNMTNYTSKIKTSTTNLKNALSKSDDPKNKEEIKEEVENLDNYRKEVDKLPHSYRLKVFHEKYCGILDNMISSAKGAVKASELKDSKELQKVKSLMDDMEQKINSLTQLKP